VQPVCSAHIMLTVHSTSDNGARKKIIREVLEYIQASGVGKRIRPTTSELSRQFPGCQVSKYQIAYRYQQANKQFYVRDEDLIKSYKLLV
jgi:hypothetical protein